MSGAGTMPLDAAADLQRALLEALRADPVVRAHLGMPARVFDQDTFAPAYPFARLERHEMTPAGSSQYGGQDHRFTLVVISRHGGRAEAREIVDVLARAAEAASFELAGQSIVLVRAVYTDVLRSSDMRSFRGLLRLRIVAEEA